MTEQEEEQKMAAAFNAGYLMEKYEPKLFQKIRTDGNKQNEFVMHMDAGARQYQKDKIINYQAEIKQRQNEKKRTR